MGRGSRDHGDEAEGEQSFVRGHGTVLVGGRTSLPIWGEGKVRT